MTLAKELFMTLARELFMTLVVVTMFIAAGYAQDNITDAHTITIGVPEVALVDVEPAGAKNISLNYTAPTEAGNPLEAATNTDLWLNYSSVKSSATPTRTVTVMVDQVIGGADLKVLASSDNGGGAGTVGSPSSEVTLTTTGQTLISGIGSCYTGDGSSKGHNLTYSLALGGTYADLEAAVGTTVTVTYTISN